MYAYINTVCMYAYTHHTYHAALMHERPGDCNLHIGMYPPLTVAATEGLAEMCRLLIAGRADVGHAVASGASDFKGSVWGEHLGVTALHAAMQSRGGSRVRAVSDALEAARVLTDAGADVNARTAAGDTALHFAAASGRAECCHLLVRLGADVNAVSSSDGDMPLQRAIRAPGEGAANVAAVLLGAGAIKDHKNVKGMTVLAMAEAGKHSHMTAALLAHKSSARAGGRSSAYGGKGRRTAELERVVYGSGCGADRLEEPVRSVGVGDGAGGGPEKVQVGVSDARSDVAQASGTRTCGSALPGLHDTAAVAGSVRGGTRALLRHCRHEGAADSNRGTDGLGDWGRAAGIEKPALPTEEEGEACASALGGRGGGAQEIGAGVRAGGERDSDLQDHVWIVGQGLADSCDDVALGTTSSVLAAGGDLFDDA